MVARKGGGGGILVIRCNRNEGGGGGVGRFSLWSFLQFWNLHFLSFRDFAWLF